MTEETKNKMAEIIAKAKGTSAKSMAPKAETEESSKSAGLVVRDIEPVKLPEGVELSDIYPVLKPSPEELAAIDYEFQSIDYGSREGDKTILLAQRYGSTVGLGDSPDFDVEKAAIDYRALAGGEKDYSKPPVIVIQGRINTVPYAGFQKVINDTTELEYAEMFMAFLDWQAIDAQSRTYQSPFNIYPVSPAQTKFKTDWNWLKSVLDRVRMLSGIITTTGYFDGEGRITIAYRTLLKGRRSIIAEWSPDCTNKTELQATYIILRDFVKLYLSGQVLK